MEERPHLPVLLPERASADADQQRSQTGLVQYEPPTEVALAIRQKNAIELFSTSVAEKIGDRIEEIEENKKKEESRRTTRGGRARPATETEEQQQEESSPESDKEKIRTRIRKGIQDPIQDFAEEELHPTTLLGYAFDDHPLVESIATMFGGIGKNIFSAIWGKVFEKEGDDSGEATGDTGSLFSKIFNFKNIFGAGSTETSDAISGDYLSPEMQENVSEIDGEIISKIHDDVAIIAQKSTGTLDEIQDQTADQKGFQQTNIKAIASGKQNRLRRIEAEREEDVDDARTLGALEKIAKGGIGRREGAVRRVGEGGGYGLGTEFASEFFAEGAWGLVKGAWSILMGSALVTAMKAVKPKTWLQVVLVILGALGIAAVSAAASKDNTEEEKDTTPDTPTPSDEVASVSSFDQLKQTIDSSPRPQPQMAGIGAGLFSNWFGGGEEEETTITKSMEHPLIGTGTEAGLTRDDAVALGKMKKDDRPRWARNFSRKDLVEMAEDNEKLIAARDTQAPPSAPLPTSPNLRFLSNTTTSAPPATTRIAPATTRAADATTRVEKRIKEVNEAITGRKQRKDEIQKIRDEHPKSFAEYNIDPETGLPSIEEGMGKAAFRLTAKKIPFGIGTAVSAGYAINRAMSGDWLGAGIEAASGIASFLPGPGTSASLFGELALIKHDQNRAIERQEAEEQQVVPLEDEIQEIEKEARMAPTSGWSPTGDPVGDLLADYQGPTYQTTPSQNMRAPDMVGGEFGPGDDVVDRLRALHPGTRDIRKRTPPPAPPKRVQREASFDQLTEDDSFIGAFTGENKADAGAHLLNFLGFEDTAMSLLKSGNDIREDGFFPWIGEQWNNLFGSEQEGIDDLGSEIIPQIDAVQPQRTHENATLPSVSAQSRRDAGDDWVGTDWTMGRDNDTLPSSYGNRKEQRAEITPQANKITKAPKARIPNKTGAPTKNISKKLVDESPVASWIEEQWNKLFGSKQESSEDENIDPILEHVRRVARGLPISSEDLDKMISLGMVTVTESTNAQGRKQTEFTGSGTKFVTVAGKYLLSQKTAQAFSRKFPGPSDLFMNPEALPWIQENAEFDYSKTKRVLKPESSFDQITKDDSFIGAFTGENKADAGAHLLNFLGADQAATGLMESGSAIQEGADESKESLGSGLGKITGTSPAPVAKTSKVAKKEDSFDRENMSIMQMLGLEQEKQRYTFRGEDDSITADEFDERAAEMIKSDPDRYSLKTDEMTGRKTLLDASAGRFKEIVGQATGTTHVINAENRLGLTTTRGGKKKEWEKHTVSGMLSQERGRGGLETAMAIRERDREDGKGRGKQSQISSLFMRTGEQEGFIPWLMGEESKISGNIRSEGTKSRIKKDTTLGTEADVNAVMDEMKSRGIDDQETLDGIRDELMSQLPWTSIFASMADKIKGIVGMEVEKPELFERYTDNLLGVGYEKSPQQVPSEISFQGSNEIERIERDEKISLQDQMILRDTATLEKYATWDERPGYEQSGGGFWNKWEGNNESLPGGLGHPERKRYKIALMNDTARRRGLAAGLSPEYHKAYPTLGPELPPSFDSPMQGPGLPPQQIPSGRSFQGSAGDRLLELDKKSKDRTAEQQTSTGGGAVVVTDQSSVVNQTSPVFMPKADTSNDSAMTQRSFG